MPPVSVISTPTAVLASTEAELQMAGYLVSQSAHSARASSNADGLCTLRLTFEN